MIKEAYPLQWPGGWKRSLYPIDSRFGSWNNKPSIAKATDKIQEEMRLFGGTNLIVSSDLKLKLNGFPYSNQKTPSDPGVAVYFTYDKEQRVIACDSFNKIGCNLWAIAKTIEALRGIDRWGCSEIIAKAFTGFTALPEHASASVGKRNWWEILRVSRNHTNTKEQMKSWYNYILKKYHPDNPDTGDQSEFIEIQKAYKDYLNG